MQVQTQSKIMLSLILILLAIVTQWFYPKLSNIQNKFLNIIDDTVDKTRLAIHKNAKLRKSTYKIPRWFFIIILWGILLIIYTIVNYYAELLSHILFYGICILCINMPISAPWKSQFTAQTIYKKWIELFSISGNEMASEQAQSNAMSIANFEECGQSMLAMWCYYFILPLLFLSLPNGDFICLTWLIIKHVCLQLKNIYLIYLIEWIPRHIILLISAILGNFESCISNARQEKKMQRSIQDISEQDSESWLWCGVKGAINIDIINSDYHYQQFLAFLSKMVLAVIVLYLFTCFI
ncbi:MAG: hypothetical protein RLZZ210_1036 [Pseudomonadota bacterium]|jgi:hypothetical protein